MSTRRKVHAIDKRQRGCFLSVPAKRNEVTGSGGRQRAVCGGEGVSCKRAADMQKGMQLTRTLHNAFIYVKGATGNFNSFDDYERTYTVRGLSFTYPFITDGVTCRIEMKCDVRVDDVTVRPSLQYDSCLHRAIRISRILWPFRLFDWTKCDARVDDVMVCPSLQYDSYLHRAIRISRILWPFELFKPIVLQSTLHPVNVR